jgi:hypothetical protein
MKFVIGRSSKASVILISAAILIALVVILGFLHDFIFGETKQPSKRLVVEREVLIPDFATVPHEVIQAADGHIIIAGERGRVNAIALTSSGGELWRYDEPFDPKIPGQYQSKFMGVVALSSGNLLFCGEKKVPNAQNPKTPDEHALISILSPGGGLISSKLLDPKDDSAMRTMGFTVCLPSDGGALLVGRIFNPLSTGSSWKPNFRWVMKVDQNGDKEWETIGDGHDDMKPPFVSPAATSSGATFSRLEHIQNGGPVVGVLHFTRVSAAGAVTSTRDIECNSLLLQFHTVDSSDDTSFLCAIIGTTMKLFRINSRLQDISAPIELEDTMHGFFDAQLGTGYKLDDGSLLIFGRVGTQSGDQAAMQLFSSAGRSLGLRVYDMNYRSFTVGYVYPLGKRSFLTLRQSNGAHAGMVLSWVNVK